MIAFFLLTRKAKHNPFLILIFKQPKIVYFCKKSMIKKQEMKRGFFSREKKKAQVFTSILVHRPYRKENGHHASIYSSCLLQDLLSATKRADRAMFLSLEKANQRRILIACLSSIYTHTYIQFIHLSIYTPRAHQATTQKRSIFSAKT